MALDPVRVVLADGNDATRHVVRRLLEDDDRFVVVADGEAATTVLAHLGDVDLVVLALRLADADGISMLSQIREVAPSVPVVLLTRHDVPYLRDEALARGCTDFIPKSRPTDDVLDRLYAAALAVPH